MIFKIIFIAVILLICFCIISLMVFNKDVEKKMKNREKIEHINISSKTIYNEDIDNSIFSDKKFTIVNIWGTYCSSCIKELPALQEIYNEFKNENIGVLGIISDLKIDSYKEKHLKKAQDIIEKNDIKYPNIFADNKFIEYATGKLFFIPTTIFVDKNGNVIGDVIESAYSKEEFLDIIKKILNNDTTFDIKNNSNLSCSIDGKCEIKK